jgi:RNA polymerase-binding transcription factor DksA
MHAAGSELTAAFDVSCLCGRVVRPLVSGLQADRLRALLVAEMRERVTELAQQATSLAVLTINPSVDPTGLDRAISALDMYRARMAIEEIDEALVRIDVGSYGTCQECDGPIPFDRLEAIPHARFCAACHPPARSTFTGGQRRGRIPGRREHTGIPPAPVCSPHHRDDVDSPRSEKARGNRIER